MQNAKWVALEQLVINSADFQSCGHGPLSLWERKENRHHYAMRIVADPLAQIPAGKSV
jgi:hypothetical protein